MTGGEDVAVLALSTEPGVEAFLAGIAVSMSEFKKNPTAVPREANDRPVAVLSRIRAAFYMVEAQAIDVDIVDL